MAASAHVGVTVSTAALPSPRWIDADSAGSALKSTVAGFSVTANVTDAPWNPRRVFTEYHSCYTDR